MTKAINTRRMLLVGGPHDGAYTDFVKGATQFWVPVKTEVDGEVRADFSVHHLYEPVEDELIYVGYVSR